MRCAGIGAFDTQESDAVTIALATARDITVDAWRVAKLVIGPTATPIAHLLPLEDAWSFIRARIHRFRARKHAGTGPTSPIR